MRLVAKMLRMVPVHHKYPVKVSHPSLLTPLILVGSSSTPLILALQVN